MAPATASPTIDAEPETDGEAHAGARRWTEMPWGGGAQVSLTPRILAVNIIALLLLAGGFFYLDTFRTRILDGRVEQARREARLMAEALSAVPPAREDALLRRLAADTGAWLRRFDASGRAIGDSEALGVDTFLLDDPLSHRLDQRAARWLDGGIDFVVRAPAPPDYTDRAAARRDVGRVQQGAVSAATIWRAPDRTPIVTAAAPLPGGGALLATLNARDVTDRVRVERFRLSMVLAIVAALSIALSLFLARTIVTPLRRLARAAVRVRRGRAREVVVPRLPERRDEIGLLARALSDMSLTLRARIDATETFAADVTHELKNPLASLRSALDVLPRVPDGEQRAKLLAVANDDVRRLDRLISDIAEASRLDAQMSRATLEPVEIGAMIQGLVAQRVARGLPRGMRLRFDAPAQPPAPVLGEGARLERVFENLIENALSFSPDGRLVSISLRDDRGVAVVRVEDEGPGVPPEAREAVFRRFHSVRPGGEAFGQHSGLGLAIARAIVEAHQGSIAVQARDDRLSGACFVVRLPTQAATA